MNKFLNCMFFSAVIFIVVLSPFSYQIAFTSPLSHADEGAAISESPDSSENESEEADAEEETDPDESDGEGNVEEPADDEEEAAEAGSGMETGDIGTTSDETVTESSTGQADADVAAPGSIDGTTDQTLSSDVLSEAEQNNDTSSDESWETCDLSDEEEDRIEDEEFDRCRQKTGCEEIRICCSEILGSSNSAGSVLNEAESDSITGGNEILGNTGSAQGMTETADPAQAQSASGENGESSDKGSEEDTESDLDESSDDAIIETGDASVQVAAINEVNTNIYTDNGQEIVENINNDYSGDIDLLEAFGSILENSKNLYSQNEDCFEKISITNINSAEDVENNVSAVADSGENKIENSEGSVSIETGDAGAIASAVNLINTNIVGNNWLFAIVNIFGNWSGDLIVPGEGLLRTPEGKMIFDKITSINYASSINNFIYSKADTGNNSESSISGNASIETGDAISQTGAVNLVNTDIVRNNWFFLMINNSGNWMGKVINWDKDTGEQNTAYEYEFGSLQNGSCTDNCLIKGKIADVYNSNYAGDVSNNVYSYADTGNNNIENAGSASIQTGNASAFASAFNFVNTNITGNNWLFGIVNNAGNWTGNVIFGYPDLEVSLSADRDGIRPGENFGYTIKYKNIGKAKCDNAELMLSLPRYLTYISDSGGSFRNDGKNYYWTSGGLDPGDEESFDISVRLDEDVPREVSALQSSTGIRTETMEKELGNNSENESIKIFHPANITIEDGDYWKKGSSVEASRSEDLQIAMGVMADHYIMVKNSGKNTLYNILVTEKIKDPSGSTAAEYYWSVEKLKKGQKATIQYQIFLSPPALLGTYNHSASVLGYNEYGYEVKSDKAKAEVRLVAGVWYPMPNQELPAPQEEAVMGAENFPTLSFPAMEARELDLRGYLRLLWLLVLAPISYYVWKNRLYRWQKMQKFAHQVSNMLSSFF